MLDDDVTLAKLARSTRAVARLSGATKVICLVMLFGAGGTMLYGLSRADDHFSDFVGFGLLALLAASLAIVFWSTAAFHGAVGDSLALIVSAHAKLDALAERGATRTKRREARAPATEVAPADGVATLTPGVAPPAIVEAVAPMQDAPTVAAAPETSSVEEPERKAAIATLADQPKPDTKSCRHCGGEIRADATRCRWCMLVVS